MKIGVAISGGVDSAVVAAKLKKQGHDVTAYHMKNLPEVLFELIPETKKVCCSPSDTADAMMTSKKLGIDFKLIKLKDDFDNKIIDYFIREYSNGRTPNPCVVCNDELKFGSLMEAAKKDGMEAFASGHYARILEDKEHGAVLAKGVSPYKDQAYFLSRIKREKLGFLRFPNGEYTKDEIRKEAKEMGLIVHSKRDSQELCFIPDNDYHRFLREKGVEFVPGEIVDIDGKVFGTHKGLPLYTIGQRQGLGIGGGERYYVIGIQIDKNRLIVGSRIETEKKSFVASDLNWLVRVTDSVIKCTCKVRSRMNEVEATVTLVEEKAYVDLEESVNAITPGQLAVFYNGEIVIGSGFIDNM